MLQIIKLILRHLFAPKTKNFLIILQNNNELRATGGFITEVIDLQIGRFQIKRKNLDVYYDLNKHQRIEAPKAIQEMLFEDHMETWTFRDANFNPDFEKSAKKLTDLYNLVYLENKVIGLMAINFSFIEDLVKICGPVNIGDKKINEQNLFHFITSEVSDIDRHNIKKIRNRKSILHEFSKKLMTKIAIKLWIWPKLFKLFGASMKSKNLQLYIVGKKYPYQFNPKQNEDFFSVIESNFLGLKSNRYIRRSIFHDTQINPSENVLNEVRVMWEHFGDYDYPISGNYNGYIRLYIPKESENIILVTQPETKYLINEENNLKIIEFKIRLQPKDKLIASLQFILPEQFIINNNFNFKFFKQSGVQNESIRKIVSVPRYFSIKNNEKGIVHDNILFLDSSDIQEDINFDINFEKNDNHPRIYSHELINSNTILIKFNEPIQEPGKEQIEIFEQGNSIKKISIKNFQLKNNKTYLYITINKIPEIPEKFYSIKLKNITNNQNISISPNPKIVTVVCRPKYFIKD